MCISEIDRFDITKSTLALVLLKAMKSYDSKQLVAWLEDQDPLIRDAAAVQLHVQTPEKELFQAIAALSEKPRHETRAACARALSQFGTPEMPFARESFDILTSLVNDPYFEVRERVIEAIGFLSSALQPSPELIQLVIAASDDAIPCVREAVAMSLMSIEESSEIVEVLSKLGNDHDPEVRDAASFVKET